MRITGAFALSLSLGAAVAVAGATSHAKGAAKKGGGGSAPTASAAEINKIKAVRLGDPKAGTFKWGMKPEEVMAQVKTAVEAKYEPRIDKARQDPGLQQRIRDEMTRELAAVKKSFTKFEGQKTGWDVSIVGPEFQQNTSEAVLVTKEDIWTRYFFFFEDGLYKMFLGFNKDAIGGKSFQEFGKGMEAKYGNGREVYRDDKTRVVDRRKVVNPGIVSKDELVESVTGPKGNTAKGSDIDDDIIDRVVGKETKKPGTEPKGKEVVVDASNLPKAASAPGSSSSSGEKKKEMSNKSSSATEDKDSAKKKGGKKSDNPMDGLEL